MNRKIAAVLLAASMLTAPAFAAGVGSNTENTPATQTATPNKAVKTTSVKKHRVHARVSHKVRHVKHVKKHVSHAKVSHKISKKAATANAKASVKENTTVGSAPAKTPVKN